jgi:hypothetical protein
MWATNQADGVPGSVRQTTGQSYTDSAPGPVVPVVQPHENVTAYVNASLSRNVSSIARGATLTDDVWTVFVAANGEHPITGGTLRINMPSGVSSWAWSVNAVGFVTYDDNSPAGGVPYIELANIVAGNHPASYMTVTISRVTHDDSLDDVGDLTAELFGGFFGNLSTTAATPRRGRRSVRARRRGGTRTPSSSTPPSCPDRTGSLGGHGTAPSGGSRRSRRTGS